MRREIGAAEYGWIAPPWFTEGDIVLPGTLLNEVGLQLPTLWPAQAFVLHVEAVGPRRVAGGQGILISRQTPRVNGEMKTDDRAHHHLHPHR